MAAPAPTLTQAGCQLARERLAAYQRYAELVEAQEAALEAGDLEAFDVLSSAALEIQASLGGGAPLTNLAHDPEAGTASFVDKVTDLLHSTMARNERIQARLRGLRHETGSEIRKTAESRPRIRTYMTGAGSEEERSLDLRL